MSDYPIREKRPHPIPPAREFMRRCEQCSADFLALAAGITGERGIWRDNGWYCSAQCGRCALATHLRTPRLNTL